MPNFALDALFILFFFMAAALVVVAVLNTYYSRKIGKQTGREGPWNYIVVHCLLMVVVSLMILSVFFPSLIDYSGLAIIVLSWVVLFADAVVLLIGLYQLHALFDKQ